MNYLDEVRKKIARDTGLTGIEAGHIARQLEKSGQDYQAFDWKTIGENMYGHGHRSKGVKSIVKNAYGINLGELDDRDSNDFLEMQVRSLQGSRSPRSIRRDERVNAKHQFKITNEKGVRKWLKHPNMYDIIGIDDKY